MYCVAPILHGKKIALSPTRIQTKHPVNDVYIFFWPRKIIITGENYSVQHPGGVEKDRRGDDLKRQRKAVSPNVKILCTT